MPWNDRRLMLTRLWKICCSNSWSFHPLKLAKWRTPQPTNQLTFLHSTYHNREFDQRRRISPNAYNGGGTWWVFLLIIPRNLKLYANFRNFNSNSVVFCLKYIMYKCYLYLSRNVTQSRKLCMLVFFLFFFCFFFVFFCLFVFKMSPKA